MSVYLRTTDGRRILFDTAKCKLVFEETEYDLTGATLDFYEADVTILEGTVGPEQMPCKVQRIEDRFTGLKVELPVRDEAARKIAVQLGKRRRWRRRQR
jgi:hypothetical protein